MAYIDVDNFAEEICKFPAIDEHCANAVICLLRRQPTIQANTTKISINLNDRVKFKLTDHGNDIFYHQYDELNKKIIRAGGIPLQPRMPDVDENGYTSMQLWYFISLYGNYIGLTSPPVIEKNEIIFDIGG